MSARGAMHVRRSLFVAATIVAIHALVFLACYTVPPLQTHQCSQSLLQLLSIPSQKQDLVNVSMLTVTMTGCSKAANWQAMGLYYSFLRCVICNCWNADDAPGNCLATHCMLLLS